MKVKLQRITSCLTRTYEAILRVAGGSAAVAAYVSAFLIAMGVIARYVFNYGVIFAVEVTIYLTAFICFIGAGYTQWQKGHINIDLVTSRLPKKVRHYLLIITLFLVI